MNHLIISITATSFSTIMLSLIYYYLYKKTKAEFMKYWTISMFIYFCGLIISVINRINGNYAEYFEVLSIIVFYLSGIFLVMGSNMFIKGNRKSKYIKFLPLGIVWIIGGDILGFSIKWIGFPIFLFIGFSFIYTGSILYEKEGKGDLALKLTKYSIIFQGISNLHYPLSRNIEWLLPWNYTLGAIMKMSIAIGFIIMYFEKSEKELMNAKLIIAQKEKRLKDIVDRQRDVIFETNPNGHIKFISNASKEIFKLSPEHIYGRRLDELITLNTYLEILESKKEDGQTQGEVFNNEGEKVYISISWKKNTINQCFNGIIGSIRDITEVKLLEQAEEYNSLKTELFANLSHDFKTPLNVILSSIQLLELYKTNGILFNEDKKFDRYMTVMKQNCYKLIRQINNLIDMSKIETGFYELNLKNVNIVSVVEDITLSVVEYTESKNIELQFDTEIEEKIVAVDEDKIDRIMLNLLSNAIKFTPESGKIFVNLYDKGDHIEISVKDTGIGIPEDKKQYIFNRYSQVNSSDKSNYFGSGIGLAIVKSLVDLHGGNIELKSTYGNGSEFIINLPNKLVEDEKFGETEIILKSSKENKVGIELANINFVKEEN